MGISTKGFNELSNKIEELESIFYDDKVAKDALGAGAAIIEARMKNNASSDPKPRSGKLRGAIKTGNVRKNKGRNTIAIGVWSSDVSYAYPVEYGHGGPHPAPAHPFIRPAFNEGKDEAYSAIRQAINDALSK